MTIIPKITTEDIRLTLNGTYDSGSGNYTFWDQTISSGSVLAQINLANIWLYGAVGSDVMNSVDELTSLRVNACELAYSCMRTLVVLSGGVITDGFNWNAGMAVQQPHLMSAYKNLISEFKDSATIYFLNLQPIGVVMESDDLTLGKPAPPMM
jgi:hypothetical protein